MRLWHIIKRKRTKFRLRIAAIVMTCITRWRKQVSMRRNHLEQSCLSFSFFFFYMKGHIFHLFFFFLVVTCTSISKVSYRSIVDFYKVLYLFISLSLASCFWENNDDHVLLFFQIDSQIVGISICNLKNSTMTTTITSRYQWEEEAYRPRWPSWRTAEREGCYTGWN